MAITNHVLCIEQSVKGQRSESNKYYCFHRSRQVRPYHESMYEVVDGSLRLSDDAETVEEGRLRDTTEPSACLGEIGQVMSRCRPCRELVSTMRTEVFRYLVQCLRSETRDGGLGTYDAHDRFIDY